MRRRILIVSKLLCLALLLLLLSARAQDFQIRTRVDLVVVPVTVKASDDRLITGLQKDDFSVLENGQKQTITNFTIDPVPLSAVVVVDTGLSAGSLSKVQQTFPALAGAFSQFDEVSVYRYDKFVAKVLDFSQDMALVQTAMNTLQAIKPDANSTPPAPGSPFSIPVPIVNGAPVIPPGQIGVFVTQPSNKIQVLNDAIFAAASDLTKRERDRRKIVLIISDGGAHGSDHTFDETVRSLLDAGIEVYAIGLDSTFLSRKVSILEEYSKTTGGDVYFVSSVQSLEQSYALSTEQARNQYVLGYVSSNKVSGTLPEFRDIEVKLAKAGLETLHRKGYYQYP
jgi:VWFA-related protein